MAHCEFGQYRLLLVEDEPITRELLGNLLSRAGFNNLECAANGEEALKRIEKQTFDLVLTDIEMPRVNGLELLRRIRAGETRQPAHSKVIIVTGHDEVAVLGTAIALDANGVIKKSTSVAALRDRIQHLLQAPEETVRPTTHYKDIATDVLPENNTSGARVSGAAQELPVDQLTEGMVLAKPVLSASGYTLMVAGDILSQGKIRLLLDLTEFLPDRKVSVVKTPVH